MEKCKYFIFGIEVLPIYISVFVNGVSRLNLCTITCKYSVYLDDEVLILFSLYCNSKRFIAVFFLNSFGQMLHNAYH